MKNIFAYISIVILCFVLYGNSLGNGFFLDDYSMLVNDTFIQNVNNLTNIAGYISDRKDEIKHFRPVSIIFRSLAYQIFKDRPFYYHFVNVLLFSLYGCLLYMLVKLFTGEMGIALTTALLFCAHPLNHIPVNYVTGHEILLMGIFSAAAAICFIAYLKDQRIWWRYVLSIVFFCLGLLTQETTVFLPVFIFFLALFWGKKDKRHSGSLCGPYLVCAALFIVFKILISGHVFAFLKEDLAARIDFFDYFLSLLYLLGWYVSRLFLPFDIVLIFSALEKTRAIWLQTFVTGFIMTGLIYVVSRKGDKNLRNIANVWFFYGFFILPFISLVYLSAMGLVIEPHWFFFSSGGFFLLFALLLKQIQVSLSVKHSLAVLVSILIFWGAVTIRYNKLWKTGKIYAQYWISVVRHNPYALRFLGDMAMREGNLNEAESYFRQVMAYGLNYINFIELSQVYLRQGNIEAAENILGHGLKKMPREAALYNDLGAIYFQEGRPQEAVQMFQKASELNPQGTLARKNLADAFILLNEFEKAAGIFQEALQRAPTREDRKSYLAKLCVCYYLLGNKEDSRKIFQEFLKANPTRKDLSGFKSICSALKADELFREMLDLSQSNQ